MPPIVADGCGVAHRGSVFDAAGNLSLEFVQFKDLNGSSGDGTAVLFRKTGQALTLSDCSFTDISSPGTGAAVCAEAGSAGFVNIRNCVFCDVRSAGNGGAVYLGAKGSVTQSEFLNNRAEKYSGGALFVGGADTSLQDCIFRGNYANAQDYKGGGALFIQARCTAENCTFSENSVFSGPNGGSGGAVYATSGADFLSCTFTKNKAFVGGACYIGSGAVTFEGCDLTENSAAGTGGAVYVNWSQSAVSASFDRCHVTDNTSAQAGTIYINYYFYPGYDDWGLGQKQLDLTHSVLCGNASGGATLFTNYSWLRLNAEGSTVVASSNRKVDLKSDYEGLTITLLQDTGIDGEIVRRTDKPLGEDACEHFLLGDALAHKYFLAPGDTENSLCLRERRFQVSIENGGDSATDGTDYVYGDSFTLPNAPTPPEGFRFTAWKYGDTLYQPGEEIALVHGHKITAVFEQFLFPVTLIYKDGERVLAGSYQKGDVIRISDLPLPLQGSFAGWLYKGAVYFPGDKVVFDGRNDTFVALFDLPAPLPPETETSETKKAEGTAAATAETKTTTEKATTTAEATTTAGTEKRRKRPYRKNRAISGSSRFLPRRSRRARARQSFSSSANAAAGKMTDKILRRLSSDLCKRILFDSPPFRRA